LALADAEQRESKALSEAFTEARSLQAAGDLEQAQRIYEQILVRRPYHTESLTLLASLCYQRGEALQGDAYVDRAIDVLGQLRRQYPNNVPVQGQLANLLLARGRRAEAEALCASLKLALYPIRATPEEFSQRRDRALLSGLPPILINALPKSASESLWNRLAAGLDMAQAHISLGLFPDCTLVGPRVASLAEGGLIAKEHVPAKPHNLAQLERHGVQKMLFHQRDPRQATLSWAHFVKDDVSMRLMAPIWRRIVPPAEVLARDLASIIDWSIDCYLPLAVDFIAGWAEAADRPDRKIEVLFLDFETYRTAPRDYIARVLAFYDIAPGRYREREGEAAEVVHLRKGALEEWREVFTPEQARRAWQRMPEGLAARFGWAA
jgi:hypothetical protein